MQIEHINEEFPYTIVRELYTEEQKERIWKELDKHQSNLIRVEDCLLYTSPSPRDRQKSRMPSSA